MRKIAVLLKFRSQKLGKKDFALLLGLFIVSSYSLRG